MIGLPNDCGIIGACAPAQLESYGIEARPLRVIWQDGGVIHHHVTVSNLLDRVRVYDHRGTIHLPRHLRMTSSANTLAKAIGKIQRRPSPVRGQWIN